MTHNKQLAASSLLDELRTLHEKQQSGVLALSQNDTRIDVFYHEDGGILFFALGLALIYPILRLLERSEQRRFSRAA